MSGKGGRILEAAKDFKIGMALVAFIFTLALSLGGFHLYKSYAVARPLEQRIKNIPGVQQVQVTDQQDALEVTVKISPTGDLKQSYTSIEKMVSTAAGAKKYTILIKDHPSRELEKIYGNLELAVYQGLANDSFLWLSDQIAHGTAGAGAKYRLQVDEQRLYLSITKDNYNLCRVINREQPAEITSQKG
jgi:hypothetical protein